MSIPIENAFTINSLAGGFFPFSVKVATQTDVISLFVCAQRVIDLCDLVEKYAKSQLVLFGVGQTSFFEEGTNRLYSLEQLAAEASIPFTRVDSETVVLPKEQLHPLLTTFDHYNLSFFDLDAEWTENQVISQVLAYREHNWQNNLPILPQLSASQFFLTSHDDCYLTLEAYAPGMAKEVFTRTLRLFAATLLEKQNRHGIELREFPLELLGSFWLDNFGISLLEQSSEISDDHLRMGVSNKPYNFREEMEYPVDFWITYEIQNRKWRVQS